MKDWKAELDEYFHGREQQGNEQPNDHSLPSGEAIAVEEFMAAVATPAFEEFGAFLREHGCRVRLRLGDSNMRIVSEYAGVEEFDYTLWAGMSVLSVELRAGSKRSPETFQNGHGNSALADTTQNDITQQLTSSYIALTTRATA